MAGRRIARLNEQLRREVAEVLRTQVRDPRVLGVTVTGAKASPDLDLARIYVRLSTQAAERKDQLDGLAASGPFVRGVLSRTLRLRRVPELRFVQDQTHESAARIEELLRSVHPAGEGVESGPTDASGATSGGNGTSSDPAAGAEPDAP